MKILAFAASSSRHSINKQLAQYAANHAATLVDNAEVELLDINDYEIPLFSEDREKELGQPDLAKAFFNKIVMRMLLLFHLQSITAHTPQHIKTYLIGHHALIKKFFRVSQHYYWPPRLAQAARVQYLQRQQVQPLTLPLRSKARCQSLAFIKTLIPRKVS